MNAIERLREAAEGWPQPNVYDDAVAAVDALYQAAKALRYSPDATGGDVLVVRDDFYALAAAVSLVEGTSSPAETAGRVDGDA